ncbi:YheC/YheD family protein [Paenibacillaceae bacterium WGS1546]|uniref:YheC/YheD family endospore coat-associated protein n=1 Tax=Cohnella sp. WGS1546 TaxID=3366810 RepID=UPI00372D2651
MKKPKGLVGIMVANRIQRKYVLNQYLKYNNASVKLFCFTPSSIDWKRRQIVGIYRKNRKWTAGKFPFPQVVYNRCYGTDQELIRRLATAIGMDKCFNHINQLNKSEIYDYLNRWLADYLPETAIYEQGNEVELLRKHNVVYFKPFYGNKGKGVYRAELTGTGEIHVGHHYFSPKWIFKREAEFQDHVRRLLGSNPYIIQKGIPVHRIKDQVFDIRALVQKNENGLWSVTNLVSRIAFKGSYNTSICVKACLADEVLKPLYPPDRVDAIKTSIYNISLRTAEIIEMNTPYHLGEFSVDVALDHDAHPWIIELNGKPQKDLYNGIRNRSVVYMRPIQYAKYLCGH